MKINLILLVNLFKREYRVGKRYAMNTVLGLITMYVIFLFLFWGYKGIAQNVLQLGDNIGGLVVGYVIWIFSLTSYQSVSTTIINEGREGTLEQLYMSVHSFKKIIGYKMLVDLLMNLIVSTIIVGILMLTTRVKLHIDLISILVALIPTVMGFSFVGLLCGGLAIVFKKIDAALNIVQFLMIGLIVAPIEKFHWMIYLPGRYGVKFIQDIMVTNKQIMDFAVKDIIAVYAIGIVYIVIGFIFYKVCERKAMVNGTLGHY